MRATHIRHFDARVHQTWEAEVPDGVLSDLQYFDAYGMPTPEFDQWVCDNGTQIGADEVDAKEDWDLAYETEVAGPLHFHGEVEDDTRAALNAAVERWRKAAEGDSNDEELDAARDLIDELAEYAGVDGVIL